MSLISPFDVSDQKKLQLLRRLDQFRHWHSLDDKRYCLVCGKIITGHEIQLVGGTRGNGPLRLICPTQRCHSIPKEWVLPTAEVLADMVMQERSSSAAAVLHQNGERKDRPVASVPIANPPMVTHLRK